MRHYFRKLSSDSPLYTLSKLYDVPVGFAPLIWGGVMLYLRSLKFGYCSISDDSSCSLNGQWFFLCFLPCANKVLYTILTVFHSNWDIFWISFNETYISPWSIISDSRLFLYREEFELSIHDNLKSHVKLEYIRRISHQRAGLESCPDTVFSWFHRKTSTDTRNKQGERYTLKFFLNIVRK